jgi:hypothetical protein
MVPSFSVVVLGMNKFEKKAIFAPLWLLKGKI